jgi:hydroxyethylthiazole kinase-like sugar kinase family protein
MKLNRSLLLQATACFTVGLGTLMALPAAVAASRAEQTELQALLQSELAACRGGQTGQALSDCTREAHAAYQQARRGVLGSGAADFTANARQRCEAHSGSDKDDCLARMAGHGNVSGSVTSGGVLRELTTYSVGARPVSPGTPASAPPQPRPRPVPIDPPR